MDSGNETEIRAVRESDLRGMNRIYAYYVKNTAVTFEDEAPSDEEFSERIRKVTAFYPCLVAVLHGEVAGYAYAGKFKDRSAYDWAVETTIYVAPGCVARGTGRKLYAALERALRSQGIVNMYACIACPKREDEYLTFGSVEFHKKTGFRTVGKFENCGNKFGRWYDMVWMEKVIGSHIKNPPRPVPFKAI